MEKDNGVNPTITHPFDTLLPWKHYSPTFQTTVLSLFSSYSYATLFFPQKHFSSSITVHVHLKDALSSTQHKHPPCHAFSRCINVLYSLTSHSPSFSHYHLFLTLVQFALIPPLDNSFRLHWPFQNSKKSSIQSFYLLLLFSLLLISFPFLFYQLTICFTIFYLFTISGVL